jgi:hypothetical protein
MATYSYSAGYQGGGPQAVPSGYIEAYSQAGRNIGAGMQQIGNAIGESLARYGQNKAESEFVQARYEQLRPYIDTVAKTGNVMDERSPESKLLADVGKFSTMSLAQKKAALMNAEFFLDRADKQRARELTDEATRQQLAAGALQLAKAQREAEGAPMLSEAIGAVAAMQPGQAPTMPFANVTQEMIARYGGRLTPEQMITLRAALRDQETESRRRLNEQAIAQVAQLPFQQEVTVPASPAIISSSLNIPAEQQPYTPFYQVQQIPGAAMQPAPAVASYAQGLGRPAPTIPQRIPIGDQAQFPQRMAAQPMPAAPAPQRIPVRDQSMLQRSAVLPTGIAPIPQREVPAFESQPIQRTVTETQPVNYQDRFKQAVDVFQRLGAPINPDAIRSVLEATGTPQPTTVEQVRDLGSVVRFGGKEQFVPRKETNIDDMLKIRGLTIDFPEFQGTAPSSKEAELFREQYKTVLDSRRDITRLLEIAGMGKAMQQSPKIKAEADQLARSVQGALRLDILGAGTVSEPDRKLLESIVRNPTDIFSLPSSNTKSLEGLLLRATNGITTRAQSLGLQASTPQAGQSRSSLASDPRVASIRARKNSGIITRQQAEQELRAIQ